MISIVPGHATSIQSWFLELEQSPSFISLDPLQFDESAEKTEDPTPKRLQQARDKGNVPKSQDLTTAVTIIIVTLFIYMMLHNFYGAVEDMFLKTFMLFSVEEMGNQDFWKLFMTLVQKS